MLINARLAAFGVAACVLTTIVSVPASAAALTVTTTVSVADIVPGLDDFTGGARNVPPFSAFSGDLAAGDDFDLTINFLPGEQLTINNLSFIWAFSYAFGGSSVVNGTGTLSLLDGSGTVLYASVSKTTDEGFAHFGQSFIKSDFIGLPTSVSFSGLRYVGKLNSYADPGVTSRTYNNPAFYFTADSFISTNLTQIPEPSSILLLATGTVLLLRRKFAQR